MDKDTIRELNEQLQAACLRSKTGAGQDVGMASAQVSMLAEIAAQLAEANKHLAKIANPLMVVNGTEDTSDLRDQLAMSAMQGLFSNSSDEFWVHKPEAMSDTCKHSYEWADAMLQARKK